MPCVNCGEDTRVEKHLLQFEREGGETKILELELCDTCLDEMLSEPFIAEA